MAMTLRLPPDLEEQVKVNAEQEHISMQAYITQAVQERLARSDQRSLLLRSAQAVKDMYPETLRRLGE